MTQIRIRDFETTDRPAVIALVRELQTAEAAIYDRMKPPAEIGDWYIDYLLDQCEHNKGRILVAVNEDSVVGYAVILSEVVSDGSVDEVAYTYAQVKDVAVTKRLRGRGIGSRLLTQCEEIARAAGARWLRISLLTENADALRAYEKAGFKPLVTKLEKPIG